MSRTKLSVLSGLVGCLLLAPGVSAGDHASAIEAYVEVWNNGKVEMLDAVAAENILRRSPTESQDNLEEVMAFITETRSMYPDLKVTNDGIFDGGDRAVLEWTFTGTQQELGKAVDFNGVSLVRFAGGKMVEELVHFDNSEVLMQLGFTITPPAMEGGDPN